MINRQGWGAQWLMAAVCALLIAAGCGSPLSEKPSNAVSSVAASKTDNRASAAQTSAGPSSADGAASRSDEIPSLPGIPITIARDLSSPDARVRSQALDFWTTKYSTMPLDAVFEAMEDEDEGVRAKAEAIVEQWWAEEQKKEQG